MWAGTLCGNNDHKSRIATTTSTYIQVYNNTLYNKIDENVFP